ncbi:MAG: hypothetical protein H5T86_06015 [Armatimonadetes bacterium]|nr:hypothetical protein [Armatimonadota bacterium]
MQGRYRTEADRSVLRAANGLPLLVRQFGGGRQRAYSIHAPSGQHIGTIRATIGPARAGVTSRWTHPEWHGRGVHIGVLRRLIGEAGEVHVPASITGAAEDAVAMSREGHPVRATGRGWAERARGERAVFGPLAAKDLGSRRQRRVLLALGALAGGRAR